MEFFTPRGQLCKLFIGHIFTWPMLQQKFKISVNVQAVCFCHLNHCVDYRTGIRSLYGIAEQPVLPAYCEWTDRILTEIVSKAASSVFQISFCCITPVENIIHGFIHPGIPDGLVTYKEDKAAVVESFKKLIADGVYREELYDYFTPRDPGLSFAQTH